jgi:hypothetical protein
MAVVHGPRRCVDVHVRVGCLQGFGLAPRETESAGTPTNLMDLSSFSRATAAMAEVPVASIGSTMTMSRASISCGILEVKYSTARSADRVSH